MNMAHERILTTQQAADLLGVKRRQVIRLITLKRLPAQKFGAMWLIREADVGAVKVRKVGYPRGRPRGPKEKVTPEERAGGLTW